MGRGRTTAPPPEYATARDALHFFRIAVAIQHCVYIRSILFLPAVTLNNLENTFKVTKLSTDSFTNAIHFLTTEPRNVRITTLSDL